MHSVPSIDPYRISLYFIKVMNMNMNTRYITFLLYPYPWLLDSLFLFYYELGSLNIYNIHKTYHLDQDASVAKTLKRLHQKNSSCVLVPVENFVGD